MSSIVSNPIFHVIIPVYNAERTLLRCLSSIDSQTFRNFVCTAVDDMSTDATSRMLDTYARTYKWLRVVHLDRKRNAGGARNAGLAQGYARGIPYTYFMDADDYLENQDAFAHMYTAVMRYGLPDLIVCRSRMSAGGNRVWPPYASAQVVGAGISGYVRMTIAHDTSVCAGAWLSCAKTTLVPQFPEDMIRGEDNVWFLSLIDKCRTLGVTDGIVYVYAYTDNHPSLTKHHNTMQEQYAASYRFMTNVMQLQLKTAHAREKACDMLHRWYHGMYLMLKKYVDKP